MPAMMSVAALVICPPDNLSLMRLGNALSSGTSRSVAENAVAGQIDGNQVAGGIKTHLAAKLVDTLDGPGEGRIRLLGWLSAAELVDLFFFGRPFSVGNCRVWTEGVWTMSLRDRGVFLDPGGSRSRGE